ncbi:hypothetical protein F5I97DRAFT_1112081 [Phlebopus sp. FC_14]|nr:hypothetical protein F5I97DRAFT_1112081 [Phlebopus sp. FC_14]
MAMVPADPLSQVEEYVRLYRALLQPLDLETPYSHYMTMNYVASPEDHGRIDAIVTERQSLIAGLTREIERVQTLRELCDVQTPLDAIQAELIERKSRVESSQTFHRALTSTIRRLPANIFGEIFRQWLPKDTCIVPGSMCSPLLLTQVCQRWRSIAMATPHLWSSLMIPLRKAVADEYRIQCDTWLARAKGIPLMLAIHGVDSSSRHLLNWLQRLISRCCDLRWYGPLLDGLLANGTVELLEKLDVNVFGMPHRRPSIDVPSGMSRLGSVCLIFAYEVNSLDGITLPWAQLTEMDMNGVNLPWTDVSRLLRICSRLQNAKFSLLDGGDLDDQQATVPGSVVNHSLKFLGIELYGQTANYLLDALVLPSLAELHLGFCYVGEWPHEQFASFIARSRCSLKKLTVAAHGSVWDHWSEYRSLLPTCTLKMIEDKASVSCWDHTV